MHHRHTSFYSLGSIQTDNPTDRGQEYVFTGGTVRWYSAPSGYLGLGVATPDAPARTSWAIASQSDDATTFHPPIINAPIEFSREFSRVFSAANAGVSPIENPEEDSRGAELVCINGHRFPTPLGELELARCRDGFWVSIPLPADVAVYGLGEKTGGLDKRGRTWVMWNADDPIHTPGTDPLYQSIPVVYIVGETTTHTLFVDSTATVYVDIGEADQDQIHVEVYDDRFEMYWAEDASLPEAVRRYTALTGRAPLPPEWALGFQQCRYSYFPHERVTEIADRIRSEQIPCDTLYLDIHYMDGYRVFTWDGERFPDPASLISDLRQRGFRLVTIVDPGVKRDPQYQAYVDGVENGFFLRNADGTVYTGRVWPGEAAFPDFYSSHVRDWWAGLHRALFDAGVAGVWNDMNEPADFTGDELDRWNFTVPDTLVSQTDGTVRSMAVLHNAYANGMNETTRTAFSRYRPAERGFVLTRAGYAGIQRSAAVWTGDNHSWWEHLSLMIPMLAGLGLSGVPFVGGDAGGFQQNADSELYSRWIAAASFAPLFRAHSALDTSDHEPWSFGDATLAVARKYIQLRYRLLPYIYSLFEEASQTGAPVLRPLVWEFPSDERVRNRSDSFLLGSALLIAPVRERGVQERSVYLPSGRWYDLWSGTVTDASPSGTVVVADAQLDTLPIFLRGGTVLPFESVRPHTGDSGDGVLRVLIAPNDAGHASGELYADAGEGFEYQDGAFYRLHVTHIPSGEIELHVIHGGIAPRWREIEIIVAGEGGCLLDQSAVARLPLPLETDERRRLEV